METCTFVVLSQLLAWGWNSRGTLGHGHRATERKPRYVSELRGVRIVQAAIGGWHCLAVDENGQVCEWCCHPLVPEVAAASQEHLTTLLKTPQWYCGCGVAGYACTHAAAGSHRRCFLPTSGRWPENMHLIANWLCPGHSSPKPSPGTV